jgi:hypothetical protein
MSITHTVTAVEAKISLALEALDLAAHFGGTWGEHPQYGVGDWTEQIASEGTRLGYWEWVANRINSGDDGPDADDEDAPLSPYLEAARAKYMGDSDIEVVDVDDTDAIDGAWVNARIFVRDDELEPVPGPTYGVWIGEPRYLDGLDPEVLPPGTPGTAIWVWTLDLSFTCDDDPDGKGARQSAHACARHLRNLYPCAFVAVRPSGKAPLPIKHP